MIFYGILSCVGLIFAYCRPMGSVGSLRYDLKRIWTGFCLLAGRPARRLTRLLRWLAVGLVLLFSPLIAWMILTLNREIIHYLVNARWLSFISPEALATMREDVNSRWFVSGFNEAALGGLLTLYGVIVTVWYYHAVRQQENVEKRLFVIDELLEELKRNKRVLEMYGNLEGDEPVTDSPPGERPFSTSSWHKLGADVALLPRRIHLRLSVLYACLRECSCLDDFLKHRATIDRIPGIIYELNKYRSKLARYEIE